MSDNEVSTTDARALVALARQLTSPQIAQAVEHFPTWSELAAADAVRRTVTLGPAAAHVRFPPEPPALDDLDGHARVLSRYDAAFPRDLAARTTDVWATWVAGQLPDRPLVAVVGTNYPAAATLAHVRTYVTDIVAARHGVLAIAGTPIAKVVCDQAVRLGARPVLIAPTGLRCLTDPAQAQHVISKGGCVVSACEPPQPWSPQTIAGAEDLLLAWAAAVVVVEVGHTAAGGLRLLTEGTALTPLLVATSAGPVPDALYAKGHIRPLDDHPGALTAVLQ